jgi:hypothetical protein
LLPFCLAALPLLLTGCAHAAANTTPDMPALAMPAPPPHDVETTEVEPPPPVPLATEPARNTQARARPAQAPRPQPEPPNRTAGGRQPPASEEPPPHPPTTLQTTPATAEGKSSAPRASLQRAKPTNRDYRAERGRAFSTTSKRFVRQADDAIRTKNLVLQKSAKATLPLNAGRPYTVMPDVNILRVT